MKKYTTHTPEETVELGREISRRLRAPQLVLLIGDLGAGKTTLTKGIVDGLGLAPPEDVLSPTFSLIHEYEGEPKLYHIDLYRLDRIPELDTLGLDDLWEKDAIVLIEWGEKFSTELPCRRMEIQIRYLDDDTREITIEEPDGDG